MTDKHHSGVPTDRMPALPRRLRKALRRARQGTLSGDSAIARAVALSAGLGAAMTFLDAPSVAYAAQARLFAEELNELEWTGEGSSVVVGCMIAPGTTSGTLKLNVGHAEFDGLIQQVPGTGGSYVLTDNIAFIAAAGVVDATNPRWVLVELTSSGTVNLNPGSASATPEIPTKTAGNIVLAAVYVPANAGAVDTADGTANGNAKIHDMRRLRRRPISGWIPDLTGYTPASPAGAASATLQPWERVSTTQFTISSSTDYSGRFKPGTKLRWSESGVVKYGHVVSSSFASSTTTVNLVANTAYSMAATPDANSVFFCDGGAHPSDFPAFFDYSPTLGGFSGTPTIGVARYTVVGNLCFVILSNISGTSNATTITVTLPFTPRNGGTVTEYPVATVTDNGTAQANAGMAQLGSGSPTLTIYKTSASSFTTSGTKGAYMTLAYPI